VIDWQASWDRNLQFDYIFEDGFIFNKNFWDSWGSVHYFPQTPIKCAMLTA
jgi:hypothetical protein